MNIKRKNNSEIRGDGNINMQDISNSKIRLNNNITGEKKSIWNIIGVVIAVIGLLVAILTDWNALITWIK